MRNVSTLLVEDNSFVREGLKSLLSQSEYNPVLEMDCLKGIRALENENNYELIILGIDCLKEGVSSFVKPLKARFSKARIVILSSKLNSDLITDSFSSGADGFILKDISADAFLGSLNLVMLGEKVFPTSMANLLSEEAKLWVANKNQRTMNDRLLSVREIDVIRCLENGESNKLIARQLNITESTVKVHLKTILRKLGLSNRTQAAIWAVNNGIKPVNVNSHSANTASNTAKTNEPQRANVA